MITYPRSVKIHKKSAELQFSLMRPKDIKDETGKVKSSETGCIFLEIAKPKNDGTEYMDWDNGLRMKIGPRDIAQIVSGVRSTGTTKLFHRSEKEGSVPTDTTLNIDPGNDNTFKWSVFKNQGDSKRNVTIFLDQYDMFMVFNMLEAAMPVIHGWVE